MSRHARTPKPDRAKKTIHPPIFLPNRRTIPQPTSLLTTHDIMALQRTVGNQAVQRMLIERQTPAQNTFSPPLGKLLPETKPERTMLKIGMRGKDVIILQRRLNVHGAKLVEDGVFGANTHQAVVEFQKQQAPPVDGIVGPITWGALDVEPGSGDTDNPGGIAETDQKTLSEMKPGRFTPYVAAQFMDHDIGVLLNTFFTRSPDAVFTADTAENTLKELNDGTLVGILTQSNVGKARAYLPKSEHDWIDTIETEGLIVKDTPRPAMTNGFNTAGKSRAIIVLADDVMANAQQPGTGRAKAEQIIGHELNHVRNMLADDNDIHHKVMFPTEFVDMALAQQITISSEKDTLGVRSSYIHELTARHAEFIMKQELLRSRGEPVTPLKHGEVFNAAIDYAISEPGNFGDNGYLKALREKDEALFHKQIAIWLRNLNVREFHNDSEINQQKQAFFEQEFQIVQGANFEPFASASRGLREEKPD